MSYYFKRYFFDNTKNNGFCLGGVQIPECPPLINESDEDPLISSIRQYIQNEKPDRITIHIIAQKPKFHQDNINYKRLIEKNLKSVFNIEHIIVHAGTGENYGKTGKGNALDLHICKNQGYGFDKHALIPKDTNKLFTLAGLQWNIGNYTIKAHSDGDLIIHAIVDALLSSMCLPDIGEFYSDKNPKNKGRSSVEFLEETLEKFHNKQLQIKHITINLFANEQIKNELLSQQFIELARNNIAQLCSIKKESITIAINAPKAFGALSRNEIIESQAIIEYV